VSEDRSTTSPSAGNGGTPACGTTTPCPVVCRLVSITIIRNATQTNVTGAKNWAAVKKATDEVVVEATTNPNIAACWQAITWSGDSGSPGDQPNQRKLSRAASRKFHIEAELGGVRDSLDVWVVWATVTINVSGTTPANAAQFGARYDGTENLGARPYNGGNSAVGKVVPEAALSPTGVNAVVRAGWALRREVISHFWIDGAKLTGEPRAWSADWVNDDSLAPFQRMTPDVNDKIFDRDAPNIEAFGANNAERYDNFRQWTEWNGEVCSDRASWHWQARWQRTAAPQVTLKDVGTGTIALPATPHFPP